MYFFRRRIHPTWIFTVACVGMVAGIAACRLTGQVTIVWLVAGLVALLFSLWQKRAWVILVALLAGMMIGLWRGGLEIGELQEYQPVFGEVKSVKGVVATDPDVKNEARSFCLSSVGIDGASPNGRLRVTINSNQPIRREDRLIVKGELAPANTVTLIGVIYKAELISVERPKNIILDVRDWFGAAVRSVVDEPMASLGLGFLLGQRNELPSDLSENLKIAGLTHIVVASGYNLTILVRVARKFFEKISRYQAALWSVSLILVFMAITGWSASMTRAGLIAGIGLWAWYYGRKSHPLTLISLAGALTAFVNPAYAWGDLGWMLSFAAFAGILVLAPLLSAYFYSNDKPSFVPRLIIETTSAQIMTLPILLVAFGKMSLVALLSNVLILPLIPLAMLLVWLVGMLQLLAPLLVGLAVIVATWLLQYMVVVVDWTAGLPWAQIEWQMTWWGGVCAYAGLAGLMIYLRIVTSYNLRQVSPVE